MSYSPAVSFPTVATVIGLSPETLRDSGHLVATIAVNHNTIMSNVETQNEQSAPAIKMDDPVTKAVFDNINGTLPLKKEPEIFRCEICNISVTKQIVLDAHLVGLKHAKKLKSLALLKELGANNSVPAVSPSMFSCIMCNVKVNSSQQLYAHIQGSKHKAKCETMQSNTTYIPASKLGITCNTGACNNGMVGIDVSANRLYCATCNINVNSDIQLHQHITSKKHLDKVNGKTPNSASQLVTKSAKSNNAWTKETPYQRKTPFHRLTLSKPPTMPPLDHTTHYGSSSNSFVSGGMLY